MRSPSAPSPRLLDVLGHLHPPPGGLWHGGPTPMSALRGVDAGQAAWKPAPDRHSIWELSLHVAYWKYAVHRRLTNGPSGAFPRGPSNWPSVPDPADEAAWKRDRALLGRMHRDLVEAVGSVNPSTLDESAPGSTRWTVMDLVSGIVLHDVYHAGQIQLMKRLYRAIGPK